MTPTDNDVAVKVWEENRRLAREEQYNFCNSPRIWHNFYITVGLLIAILSYVEWVHLGPLTFSGDGMAGAMVAGCDDDPYPGCRQTVYHYRKAEMGAATVWSRMPFRRTSVSVRFKQ